MKTLLLSLFVLMYINSSAQWNQLYGPEGSSDYSIAKTSHGIYCGTSGGLYVSINEGQTWQKVTTIDDYSILEIVSISDTLVVIYTLFNSTSSNYEYFSTSSFDNTVTWTAPNLYQTSSSTFNSVTLYLQGSVLFSGGQNGTYYSNNYGQTWSILTSPNADNISSTSFFGNYLIVETMNVTTYHRERFVSAYGSLNWQLIDTFPNSPYKTMIDSAFFVSVIRPPDNLYLRTFDFGQNWDTLFTTPDTVLFGLHADGNLLYRFTQQSVFSMSTDFGNTWTPSGGPNWYVSDQRIPLSNGDLLAVKYPAGLVHYVTATDTFYSSVTGILSQVCTFFRSYNGILFATVSGGFYSSRDAGLTWVKLNTMITGIRNMMVSGDTIVCISDIYISKSIDNGFSWDTVMAPQTSYIDGAGIEIIGSRVYVSGMEVFYSDDLCENWQMTANIIPDSVNCNSQNPDYGIIRRDGTDLFIVTNNGMVYKYDAINNVWIYSFCFWSTGAHNGNYLYKVDNHLVISGRLQMYTSGDHGLTWSTPALTGIPLNSSSSPIVPRSIISSNGLWFGSCGASGIFASSDHGNSWFPIPVSGFAPSGIALLNDILYSSTRGEGIWKRNGVYRNYSGKIYIDINQNNVLDSGDILKSQLIVTSNPSSRVTSTDSSGMYQLTTDAVGDVLSPNNISPYVFFSPPNYILDTIQLQNLDFSVQFSSMVTDFTIDIASSTGYRYADTTNFYVTVTNNGSIKQNGSFSLNLPSQQLSFISSSTTPVSIIGDTITWDFDSLGFLEKSTFAINIFTLHTNSIGDTISLSADVFPSLTDTIPVDNNFTFRDIVRGAFDPNDKTCLEGNIVTTQQINNLKTLNYLVRFQNTGNLPATTVVIIDTLSYFLDWSTFNVISSSNPVTWSISGDRIVRFEFANINLVDSTADEPNSHGFVKYKIDARDQLQSGNTISNTAYIYFDSNPAIQTNSTLTTIIDHVILNSTVVNYYSNVKVLVFPNPANEETTILLEGEKSQKKLNIYNTIGRLILTRNFSNESIKINTSMLESGIYFGEIVSKSGNKFSSFRILIEH